MLSRKKENGMKSVSYKLLDTWSDSIAFYAQTNWDIKFIKKGGLKIGFYFPESDHQESKYVVNEVDKLLEWLSGKFKSDSISELNFVVKIIYTNCFLKSARKLPLSIKEKLASNLEVLRKNPFDTILRTKSLTGKLAGFYSFRVTRLASNFLLFRSWNSKIN